MSFVPHFEVTDVGGIRVRYRDIWQRANLLLVCLAGADAAVASRYRDALAAANAELARHETRVVVTGESVPGLPTPSIVIADRWGEIQYTAPLDDPPPLDELVEWLRFVQMRCPECEGESH